jgi:ABC-2 type transport system permease protein
MLLVTALFPVYYNVLSQFVNRRDELVLKRMRTGETRDAELIVSIALPGAIGAVVLSAGRRAHRACARPAAAPEPAAPRGAGGADRRHVRAFAYWTAAWTRNAEAAQLTSLPLILLVSVGPLTAAIPDLSDPLRELLSLTPGAAMSDLVRAGWFGLDGPTATDPTLTAAATWGQAAEPLRVIAAWTVLAVVLARRSMRWEPRT